MEKIKKILAPTDLSELSQAGVLYALELARALRAEITVYYVVGSERAAPAGEEIERNGAGDNGCCPRGSALERRQIALSRFLTDHFSDLIPWLKVREKVEIGIPERSIVERARVEAADLIVMATHERSGPCDRLRGSVTEHLVRHAPCPVLSIRRQPDRTITEEPDEAAW